MTLTIEGPGTRPARCLHFVSRPAGIIEPCAGFCFSAPWLARRAAASGCLPRRSLPPRHPQRSKPARCRPLGQKGSAVFETKSPGLSARCGGYGGVRGSDRRARRQRPMTPFYDLSNPRECCDGCGDEGRFGVSRAACWSRGGDLKGEPIY